MLKLYRRQNGKITHYHEAWARGSTLIEHWGELGQRGHIRKYKVKPGRSPEEAIARLLKPAIDAGFEAVNFDGQEILLIQYQIDGFGSVRELEKRHKLEDRLNETLGWTGVGRVDGGSIGSGTMEVACIVLDVDLAKRVIEEDLRGTPFGDYAQICVEH